MGVQGRQSGYFFGQVLVTFTMPNGAMLPFNRFGWVMEITSRYAFIDVVVDGKLLVDLEIWSLPAGIVLWNRGNQKGSWWIKDSLTCGLHSLGPREMSLRGFGGNRLYYGFERSPCQY